MLAGWAYGAIYALQPERTAALSAGSGTTTTDDHTAASATAPPAASTGGTTSSGKWDWWIPGLAAEAIRAGLVDDCHLLVSPVAVGGGTPAFPDGVRWDLELVDERRFGNGVVHLHYRSAG